MTLRRSLLLAMTGLTALGLLIVTGTAAVMLRSYLIDRTDDQLLAAVELARHRYRLDVLPPEQRPRTVQEIVSVTEYLIEVRGDRIGTLRMVGTVPLPTRPLLDRADLDATGPQNVDGFRAVVVRDRGLTILVALPLDRAGDTVGRLVAIAAVTSLVALAVLTAFARWLLIRRLRPLNEIAAAATALADGHLDRRVPEPPHGPLTEVGRLTGAVNGMLSRIQAALAARERSERRVRDFVADASHELRTPVTAVRGYLQLIRTGVVDLNDRPDVLHRLEQEANRMSAMVSSLLYLARLDAEPPVRRGPVDVAALARDAVADAGALDQDRPLTVDAPERCVVSGDEDPLRRVLANLLGNVRVHTPPGTAARVTVTDEAARVRVAVTDDGPGLDADAAAHAFDRFWRGGTARSAGDGAGLGLAIVAEVVRAHGGDIGVDGATVWFTLPR
ncbi:two-component system OmpR family sensor kinase [Catenuloplanes nepalensis]|uniref:histidine kinase n=1 Tax=Catenuloplanes nepalensis TaxID=587533 RepID=A0ABT9MRK0_9ACTN|nr:HAMP domain-containing sensor histidine kinase [Catenuloplanes nepalensis]MDP9794054.1 two-component system OmpR family sensor kinase [Catenuloplanes nepalensis]